MFRPNRIGTPLIHMMTQASTAAAWVMNASAINLPGITGNVINAVPQLDFGFDALMASNTGSGLGNNQQAAILQQFTVTAPLAGDTVGFELNAGFYGIMDRRVVIIPILAKLAAAGVTVLAAVNSNSYHPVFIDEYKDQTDTEGTDAGYIGCQYRNIQVIHKDATPAGVYAHGFLLINSSGGSTGFSVMKMNASVRQLNDQQTVGYRDTLR